MSAARLGVAVRALIGVDAQASRAAELDVLNAAGVDIELVALQRGPVFDNRQTPAGRVQIAYQASDPMPATAIPERWRTTQTVLLGPIAAELKSEWAAALAPDAFVALAWQGLLRDLVPGRPVRRLPLARILLVERANALFVSAEDALPETSLYGLIGPGQHLFLTHGAYGAVALHLVDGRLGGRHVPPLPRRVPIDTTGTGDVFVAAWLAARSLAPAAEDWRHLAIAAAAASLNVTAQGLASVPDSQAVVDVLVRPRG
jgi:Sugar kinases, ribokinase family